MPSALVFDAYGPLYWIDRTGAPVDRLGFEPDGIVKGLNEVLP